MMGKQAVAAVTSVVAHLAVWAAMPAEPPTAQDPGRVLTFRLAEPAEPTPADAPASEPHPEVEAPASTPVPRPRGRRPEPRVVAAEPEPADLNPDPDFDALLDGLLHSEDVGAGPSAIVGEATGATDWALREARGPEGGAPRTGDARAHRCADPIAGTWRASLFDPARGGWVVFTLYIQRELARLNGSIQTHSWNGDRTTTAPRACGPGVREARVIMDGHGRYAGGRFRFDGSHSRESALCGGHGQGVALTHSRGFVRAGVMTVTRDDGPSLRLQRVACANTADASRIRQAMAEMGR